MTKIVFNTQDLLNKEVNVFPHKIDSIEKLIQYGWQINRFNHPFGIQCEVSQHINGPMPKVFFYTHCPQVANKICEDFAVEGINATV